MKISLFSGTAIRSLVIAALILMATRRGEKKLAEKLAGRL